MNNWSDDEDEDYNDVEELVQPSRDFPISDNEEDGEEDEYDMYELAKLTIRKNTSDDLFQIKVDKSENKKEIKEVKQVKTEKKINMNTYIWNKEVKSLQTRKFNPRLPPPDKYNKNKSFFNINMKDFPSL
jgi:hypothetical protein